MTTTENKSYTDWAKWVAILALLAVGLALNSQYEHIDKSIRVGVGLLYVAVLILFAFWTTQGRVFWRFLKDARMEMRKVSWPTRQETVQTTMMIMAVVAVVGLMLWGVDSVFMSLIGWITGQRG